MFAELKELAEIHAGYPFRGSVQRMEDGDALALQIRDIETGRAVNWAGAVCTRLEGRKSPNWLQKGDILFAARGARNFAVCLGEVPAPAVASQYFFLLRVRDLGTLMPEFLAWQINQAPAQRYLRKNAEGTDQLNIRRAILEALQVAVPPLARQRQLVELAETAQRERETHERLIANRERQLHLLVEKLFSQP